MIRVVVLSATVSIIVGSLAGAWLAAQFGLWPVLAGVAVWYAAVPFVYRRMFPEGVIR